MWHSSPRLNVSQSNNHSTTYGFDPPDAMNFAPYQDESPEVERTFSPPPNNGHLRSPSGPSPVAGQPPGTFAGEGRIQQASGSGGGGYGNTGFGSDLEGGRQNLAAFDTSLPIRMDFEAMLAYLLLPPAGGVFLLLVEHKSDYVRFHAWQSAMLFTMIFILHLILSFSSFLSWLLFIGDIALIGFLSLHAYRDVDTLDHFEVPIFGRLANSFVDDE